MLTMKLDGELDDFQSWEFTGSDGVKWWEVRHKDDPPDLAALNRIQDIHDAMQEPVENVMRSGSLDFVVPPSEGGTQWQGPPLPPLTSRWEDYLFEELDTRNK